jgi:UMF1 family MFS transporter
MKIRSSERDTWLNGRSVAWASYDVASSVYVGIVPAVLAPLYIRELSAGFHNPTAVWGIVSAAAVVVSSLMALAAASAAGRVPRFTLLIGLTAGLLAAMAVLAWAPHSSLVLGAAAFVAAQSFYFAATSIYESFLPDIVPAERRQKLSGFGWATGYLGGLFAIIVLLMLISGKPQSMDVLVLCFGALALIASAFFAIVLLVLRRQGFATLGGAGSPELRGVLAAVGQLRSNKSLFRLLMGTVLVQMALFVVVTFTTPILSDRFGQSLGDLLWLLLIIHVVSVPSTLAWSHFMTGATRAAATAALLMCWGIVLLLLAFGSGSWMPVVTITVIGCCLGATFSGLRGFLAESAGVSNTVALFALATALGRIAAALGPALFSLITLAAGERAALLVMLIVLACGSGIILVYLKGEAELPKKAAQPAAGH